VPRAQDFTQLVAGDRSAGLPPPVFGVLFRLFQSIARKRGPDSRVVRGSTGAGVRGRLRTRMWCPPVPRQIICQCRTETP
jgi:hypothetical protein